MFRKRISRRFKSVVAFALTLAMVFSLVDSSTLIAFADETDDEVVTTTLDDEAETSETTQDASSEESESEDTTDEDADALIEEAIDESGDENLEITSLDSTEAEIEAASDETEEEDEEEDEDEELSYKDLTSDKVIFEGLPEVEDYSSEEGVGFSDIEYDNEAAGWVSSIYYPRVASTNHEAGTSYVAEGDGYITVSSKVWTETESTGYGVYTYENTSSYDLDVVNADYTVEVTFTNPTSADYTAYLEAEDITKVSAFTVAAGSTNTVSATACVTDGQLNIKFLASSSATSVDAASVQNVYVSNVKITRLATEEQGTKPTIYIASDSTVQTYDEYYYPQTGWGQVLAMFFDDGDINEYEAENCTYSQAQCYETENVIVENRAIGGRSSSSFVSEGKLDDLLEDIKPGDYLLIQWGHNDATYSRPNRYVSATADNDGDGTYDFEQWLQYYIDGAIQRGATPVLVTPVARYSYTTDSDGNLISYASNFEAYRQVMIKMSQEQGIALVDLTQRSIDVANSFGIDGGKSLWLWVNAGDYTTGAYAGGASDSTHLQYYGAYKFAQQVAKGLVEASAATSSYDAEGYISDDNKTSLSSVASYVDLKLATTAPGTVTGLTTGSVGSSSVSLTWTADDNSEMYYIYRAEVDSEEEGAEYVFDDDATKYSVSASAKYTDSSCEEGKTYVYAIRGFNDMGLGEYSETIVVTTKSAGFRFDFNYGSSDTADGWTGITQAQLYDEEVGYGWSSSSYPNNGRARGGNESKVSDSSLYAMAYDFNLGSGEFLVDLPNGDYEVTIYAADLLDGTSTIKATYTAEGDSFGTISCKQSLGSCTGTVRVTDGQLNITVGGSNAYINGLTITELLLAPSGLTEKETNVVGSSYQFLLGFNPVSDAAGYNIYRKGTTDSGYSVVKTFTVEEYAADELGCCQMTCNLGENYSFYMTCYTSDGTESAPSDAIDITAQLDVDTPEAPTNLVVTDPTEDTDGVQESISLSWDAATVSDASYPVIKYIIYRSDKAEDAKGFTGYEKIGESTTTSYTDTGVKTNIHYYYKVCASNAGGAGELSEACESPITGSLVAGNQENLTDRALTVIALSEDVVAYDTDGSEITEGVYLSWRAFDEDMDSDNNLTTTFTVYVNGTAVSTAKDISKTNLVLTGIEVTDSTVFTVVGSNDSEVNGGLNVIETKAWDNQYVELSLYKPADETMPDDSVATYTANDMSVGDVDGDGVLELIVKWYPSNAKDNSGSGYTGTTILDTYDVDFNTGAVALLSRIDLGVNIRSGAHYTQFQVWDYDGDGKAEIAAKTADGSTIYASEDGTDQTLYQVDGAQYVGACDNTELPTNVVSEENDYRNTSGYILSGSEYFTMFNPEEGTILDTVDYTPSRGTVSKWGDAYGNRVDRFLSATAYLDGEHPFAVMCRGYYTRTALTAYGVKDTDEDGIGDTIYEYWAYDTDNGDGPEGQGNHNLAVADVDNDGKDEIVYGASCYDDDGTLKYSTNLGHGDAMHVSDWVAWNEGLEVMEVHEEQNQTYQVEIHDAETGEILIGYPVANADVGRGVAADIDPTSLGAEFWASKAADQTGSGEWDSVDSVVYGTQNSSTTYWDALTVGSTPAVNAMLYWDGDLLAEIQDHTFNSTAYAPTGVVIADWDYENGVQENLLYSTEIYSSNGTKGNLGLIADLTGDWREEFIARCSADDSKVRLYTTTYVTDYVVPCLLEDLQYREGVAWENVAYNQPTHSSYLLSNGLVTAQLSVADTDTSSVTINFTAANDGTLYGHEITGYAIYRDGELIDTVDVDDLDLATESDEETVEEEETAEATGTWNYVYSQDFEDGTSDFTLVGGAEILAADTATDNANTSDYIYGVWGNNQSGARGATSPSIEDADEDGVIVETDFRLEGSMGGKSQSSSICLSGAYNKTTNELKSQIVTVSAATDATNGYIDSVTINGVDITEAAVVSGSNSTASNKEASTYGLARGTTGWLHMSATLDFTDATADVVITRISDGSTVYEGTVDFLDSTVTSLSSIYLLAGRAYGEVNVDNIKVGYYTAPVVETTTTETTTTDEAETVYTYVDSSADIKSNTSYTYKIAAIVDGKPSYKSASVSATTLVEIAEVEDIELDDLVIGTPYTSSVAELLPSTATVVDTEGNEQSAAITWDVSEVDMTTVGTYKVVAYVKGYATAIELEVNVVENALKGFETLDDIEVIQNSTSVTLPSTINVEYTNTTTETLAVTWDTSALDLTTVGEYVLEGTIDTEVAGLDTNPTVKVIVVADYPVSIATSYAEVSVGDENPADSLPKYVTATMASGSTKDLAVTWKESNVEAIDTSAPGETYIHGTVAEDESFDVLLTLTIAYEAIYKFDFGITSGRTSDGWTAITVNAKGGEKTVSDLGLEYTEEKGYGYVVEDESTIIQGRTEEYTLAGNYPYYVYTDFALNSGTTFVVDVPNGDYIVDIMTTCGIGSSSASISVEGQDAVSFSNSKANYTVKSISATVEDGQLTIVDKSTLSRIGAIVVRQVALAHTHNLTKVEAVEATCTTDGNIEYYVCDGCDGVFDEDGNALEDVIIPATGHVNVTSVTTVDVAATCTEAGSMTIVTTCDDCGEVISTEVEEIPATGHVNTVENSTEVAATCTEAGSITTVVTCSDCGEEISTTVEEIPATGHDYLTVVEKASVGNAGKTYEVCNVCGDIINETVIAAPVVKLSDKTFAYDGNVNKPEVTVTDTDGNTLVEGSDYTVEIPDSIEKGSYEVTVTFTGKYEGTYTDTYYIVSATTEAVVETVETVVEVVTTVVSTVVSTIGNIFKKLFGRH